MPHIRILRHYIHAPYLIMSLVEMVLLGGAAYLGYLTRWAELPSPAYFVTALFFAVTMVTAMVSMGVYESRTREGFVGMTLRTAVAIFLLGSAAVAVVSFAFKGIDVSRGVLLFATIEGFVLLTFWRWATGTLIAEDMLKRRVLVLGTGKKAGAIASRMRRRSDRRGFHLVGFLSLGDNDDAVSGYGVTVLPAPDDLAAYCERHDIDEIVDAIDERRRGDGAAGPIPMEQLVECRLSGIEICEVQAFIERESSKVNVDLLEPSWIVFSDGFVANLWRSVSKRIFDIVAGTLILILSLPVMLLTALAIKLTSQGTILYRQMRVGENGEVFELLKFRSMVMNADREGAGAWTTYQDPRVTPVGRFIRQTRIDELPQLFNVLRGQMSFVGPRPELPEAVAKLRELIPYYDYRHRIKPGITGWAQLCYPYGASVEDAKEKLQYDLYYLKNHSLLLDLIILLQTVEVVLVGEGAR